MKTYRELEIYQISHDLAVRVHKMTLRLPQFELYEEGSQLRRSAKGIASCIVEGYGRRKYKAEFARFLVYAHASCDETIEHLRVIADTHDNVKDDAERFMAEYNQLGGKIHRFLKCVESDWQSGGRNEDDP